MAFCPSGETSQSMKAWPSSFFTCGCFAGFTSMTPYWLKSLLSPSTEIARPPRFLNDKPGAAIGQHVGIRGRRGVERRAHALPDPLLPPPLLLLHVHSAALP